MEAGDGGEVVENECGLVSTSVGVFQNRVSHELLTASYYEKDQIYGVYELLEGLWGSWEP